MLTTDSPTLAESAREQCVLRVSTGSAPRPPVDTRILGCSSPLVKWGWFAFSRLLFPVSPYLYNKINASEIRAALCGLGNETRRCKVCSLGFRHIFPPNMFDW